MWIFILIVILVAAAAVGFGFLYKNKANSIKIPLHSNPVLAECEEKISKCHHEIDGLCAYQMQHLQAFCFAEKTAKPEKTLLFKFYNSNTKARLFFYKENLNPNRQVENDNDILQKVANYQIHLDLEMQKIIFWEKIFKLRQEMNAYEKMLITKYNDLEFEYKDATEIEQIKKCLVELKKLCS